MGVLDAFLATWSKARQTYGQSTPTGGAQFDGSASLRGLQSDVESAAPGGHWQGGAATAYAAHNTEHAQMFGKLADLDTRLAAEIDKSAQVVTSGRVDLDNVRDWVVSAASSVPPNQAGEIMTMPIVSKGIGQLSEVMLKSNGELNAIGANIHQIGTEYASLSGDPPLSPQDDPVIDPLPDIMDAATWRLEFEELNNEIALHSAAVAAHARARPPSTDVAGTIAWNTAGARLQARYEALQSKQIELVQMAAELGLPEPEILPAPPVGASGEGPQGVVPSGLFSVRPSDNKGLPA